jgi:hypothetical protein
MLVELVIAWDHVAAKKLNCGLLAIVGKLLNLL